MRPFSAAVANDLASMMGEMVGGNNNGGGTADPRPLVYVHTLIADDRGIKELERKLEIVRVSESGRKGG
ncbi:hypothetical protein D3C76_763830 [compost metagenome]